MGRGCATRKEVERLATSSTGNKIQVALKPAIRLAPAGWRSRLRANRPPTGPVELNMPFSLERVLLLLRWLVIGLALAIQLYAASGSSGIEGIARAFQFTALAAIYNSLLMVLRYYARPRRDRIILAVVDAAAVTVLIGLGGGIYSPYIFLLYLIIVEAALLFTPSGILTYSAVVGMFYVTAAMLLPGQKWNELSITIVLSVVLGMFIWASVCGAITRAFEQERSLMRREQELTAELNRQVVALSSLNRLSERLNASLDLDELMGSTVEELPDALAVDACVAFLATNNGPRGWELGSVWYGVDEDFEPVETNLAGLELEGGPEQWVQVGPLVLSRADLESVLERRQSLRLGAASSEAAEGHSVQAPTEAEPCVLIVPLSPDDNFGGALALLRQAGPAFSQSDQEILSALARQLSLLARNARLYELERHNVARLQELEQMKSDFLSTVSHELRTPLTSIKASTLLMLSQPAVADDTTARLLRNVDRNTERLSALVTDLLDMAKLQNGRVKLTQAPTNLADLASDALATIRPLTDSKGQGLELKLAAGLPLAWADRRRVEQVLNNLLSNAHRYTPKGGLITLNLAQRGGELVVSISDTGPGIAPPEHNLVFERFYRGQSGKGGTGLGLSIARSLVELHGGRIWVESTPGQGSLFSFTLPVAPSLPLPVALGGVPSGPARRTAN